MTAEGRSLLPLSGIGGPAGLAAQTGKAATARGVLVQSVPADEGFWVGSSESDRVWVQLTGAAGESPYQVQKGDRVDFTGRVVRHEAASPGRSASTTARAPRC